MSRAVNCQPTSRCAAIEAIEKPESERFAGRQLLEESNGTTTTPPKPSEWRCFANRPL